MVEFVVAAVGLGVDFGIFALAGLLGLRFSGRARGTRLWFPVSVLFGGTAMYGGVDALAGVALLLNDPLLSAQLTIVASMASGITAGALFNFVTSYPRPLSGPAVRIAVPTVYFAGLTYSLLTPTRLLIEQPAVGAETPVYGPLYGVFTFVLLTIVAASGAWTTFLAARGRTDVERKGGLALTVSIVVPLVLYGVVSAFAGAIGIGGPAVSVYYLSFMGCIATFLYTRRLEPPIQSTFRSLVDSVDEGVIVVDGAGRVSSVNPAARRLLGIGDEATGQEGVADLFTRTLGNAEKASFVERTLMGVQRGRIESHDATLEGMGPRKLTLRWRVFPLGRRNPQGEADGALLMLHDETRRHALERTTEQSRDVLDLVIRMLGHDLKAPLTVMQGYIDLDKMRLDSSTDGATAAKVKTDLDKMAEAVVGMHMMMGNARALSRLAAASGEGPERVEVDLSKMVGQAVDLLGPAAASKQITVERHVEQGVRLKLVPGFDSVPRNLVDNAIKYTPPGGTVSVSLAKAGDTVRLKVSDTGQGIPPERKDRLFRKFERLGAERGTTEGHGLGLSIVAKLVELADGKIEAAERDDGKSGAVFIVDLPVPKN